MRTKDMLFELEDITLLYQYLYMNKNHKITFNNGLTDLTIRMTDDLYILCKNESFPDLPETAFSESMTIPYVLGIIDRLKEYPASEYRMTFSNRWDELKTTTLANLAQNHLWRR